MCHDLAVVTPDAPHSPDPESSDFLGALLRRIWIPILCAAVAGIGAWTFANRPRDYTATALLQVANPDIDREIVGLSQNNKPIENILGEMVPQIDQYRTAQRAVERLQLAPFANPGQVLGATSVEVQRETGLIAVNAKSRRPSEAAKIANAFAQGFLDRQLAADTVKIHRARVNLERVARARAKRGRRNPLALNDLDSLTDRVEQLRLTEEIRPQSVKLARAAGAPSEPSGLPPLLLLGAGTALGLLLGIALIAIREQTDKRIRTVRGLERALGAPVLARLPRSRALRRRARVSELSDAEAEPFRLLLTRLQLGGNGEPVRAIIVTSPGPDERARSASWYLAAIAAASGVRTLLVEAGRDQPTALPRRAGGDKKGVPARAGLSDFLRGDAPLVDVAEQVDAGDGRAIDVVGPGNGHGVAQLTTQRATTRLLEEAAQYDLTVIDAPPLPAVADAVSLVAKVSHVVAVCSRGDVTREEAERLRTTLDELDADLLGTLAVGYGRGAW
jgi:capsular polysaccharide biosynthesis protein